MQLTNQDVKEIKIKAKRGQYAEVLQKLSELKGEMLTPYDVVDEARSEDSPLHNAFTWDDAKAGEKYRLMEARVLLAKVSINYMGEEQPAFINTRVVINNQLTQGYFPIERVLSDEEIKKAVLRDAVRELEYAQQKYKRLSELKGIINTKKLKELKEKVSV